MSAGDAKKGTKRKRKCPSCKSEHVIPIVYGLPGWELAEEAEKGHVELGGCCVDANNQIGNARLVGKHGRCLGV